MPQTAYVEERPKNFSTHERMEAQHLTVPGRSFFEKWPLRWTFTLFTWTCVGLFFASQSLLWDQYLFRTTITWERAVTINLSFYYIWACIAPLVLWLGKRYQFERTSWPKAILVHLPTSILLSAAQLLVAEVVFQSFRPYPLKLFEAFRAIQVSFAFNFHMNLLTYWVILGVGSLRDYYGKYRDRDLRNAQLEAQLTQAQLQALKMQLHPHFLFNTLNTISSLMHKNVQDADWVLARLGELLRASLKNSNVHEIPLREELEFLRRYLEIEQIRFGERLKVEIRVDSGLLDLKVPSFILQPLVENSIRYTIGSHTSGGLIEITAEQLQGRLKLNVKDNGPGLVVDHAVTGPEGVGLQNTRARLQQLYGDNHEFAFINHPHQGVDVSITIPVPVSRN